MKPLAVAAAESIAVAESTEIIVALCAVSTTEPTKSVSVSAEPVAKTKTVVAALEPVAKEPTVVIEPVAEQPADEVAEDSTAAKAITKEPASEITSVVMVMMTVVVSESVVAVTVAVSRHANYPYRCSSIRK